MVEQGKIIEILLIRLYATYAQGKDARSLSAIVGEEALSETDRKYLKIANNFERKVC